MFFKHSNTSLWWLQKNAIWQWKNHSACVGRSGGGSQVHQKEWNKQKANEYEGFDLVEWDVICHTQIVFIWEQQNVSRMFFFKQDRRWNSPQTLSAPWVVTKFITWLLLQTGRVSSGLLVTFLPVHYTPKRTIFLPTGNCILKFSKRVTSE